MRRYLLLVSLVAALAAPACAHQPETTQADGRTFKVGFVGQAIPVYGVAGSAATGAVAGAGTYRSDWLDLNRFVGGVSFDVAWTGGSGSPDGVLTVEVSNADTPAGLSTATLALTLGNAPTAISGNSGNSGVDAPLTGFRWVRLVATVAAGTFTLTANGYIKRIN